MDKTLIDKTVGKDFAQICRVCLKQGGVHEFQSSLFDFYKMLTGTLQEGDLNFPVSNACKQCICYLEDILTFVERSKSHESMLKECFKITNKASNVSNPDKIEGVSNSEINKTNQNVRKNKLDKMSSVIKPEMDEISLNNCQKEVKVEQMYVNDEELIKDLSFERKISKEGDTNLNKCDICGKSFKTKTSLTEHSKIHSVKVLLTCDMCDEVFTQQITFEHHIKSHLEHKPFNCNQCGLSFIRKCDLTSHMIIHDPNKLFKCEICSKAFKRKSSLKIHVKYHVGDKKFKCEFCGKTFVRKSACTEHVNRHKGIKLHMCEQCGKSFVSSVDLKQHSLLHDSKKFKCNVCNKMFRQKFALKDHINRHEGIKPYKCERCDKSFVSKAELRQHVSVHKGERKFKCDICGMSFNRKHHLNAHMERKLKNKNYIA